MASFMEGLKETTDARERIVEFLQSIKNEEYDENEGESTEQENES